MKPTEAAALLTIAASFDNRKPDADAAKAWAMALDGMRFEDCRDAVVAHYRATRDWMMPSDVITIVKRVRRDRLMVFGALPDPPREIDPDNTPAMLAWETGVRRAVADGTLTRETPETPTLTRADSAARIKEIRAGLARRAPEPERPSLDELAANAVKADENRTRAARENA